MAVDHGQLNDDVIQFIKIWDYCAVSHDQIICENYSDAYNKHNNY